MLTDQVAVMSDYKLKDRKELEENLRRINESFGFEDAHLELSSDFRAESLVSFVKEHFYPDETLCKSIGFQFDDEVTDLFSKRLKENLSVLLISNTTNEIIACRTMAITKRDDKADWSNVKNRKWVDIVTFLGHKYCEMDVFKRFNVDTAISFVALATHRDYRGKGIASNLMKATLKFCKGLGLTPVCIKGEGTSRYSQRIFEKFGFETIHVTRHDEYKPYGEIVFKHTGNNDTTNCYVKKLEA